MNRFIKLGKQRLEEAKILKYSAKSSTEIEFYYNSEVQELKGWQTEKFDTESERNQALEHLDNIIMYGYYN
jgi:hypothetical protein